MEKEQSEYDLSDPERAALMQYIYHLTQAAAIIADNVKLRRLIKIIRAAKLGAYDPKF
jgi:hypothetical protein